MRSHLEITLTLRVCQSDGLSSRYSLGIRVIFSAVKHFLAQNVAGFTCAGAGGFLRGGVAKSSRYFQLSCWAPVTV
jgi:hypothetical protein